VASGATPVRGLGTYLIHILRGEVDLESQDPDVLRPPAAVLGGSVEVHPVAHFCQTFFAFFLPNVTSRVVALLPSSLWTAAAARATRNWCLRRTIDID
jgi:hypothetical protein